MDKAFEFVEDDLDRLSKLGLPYCKVIVSRKHERLHVSERGTAGKGKRFFLFSCSKPITVAGTMRLVERGMIKLDDAVDEYLPSFRDVYLVKNGKKLRPETRMTVRHLFTMSSGLDYELHTEPIRRAAGVPDATTTDVVNAFPKSPLSFDPGEKYQYSLSHDVLGAIVETVTGKPFDIYLGDEVFEPLGMEQTSFRYTEKEMAPQYRFDADKKEYEHIPCGCDYILAPRYASGGAGIISTAEDYALFADAMACGGTAWNGYQLLKPETVKEIHTEQLTGFVRDPTFGCPISPGYGYGLGVRTLIDRSAGQRSPIGEFGWDGAAGSFLLCDDTNGISVAFVTHVFGWTGIRPVFHGPLRDAVYESLGF